MDEANQQISNTVDTIERDPVRSPGIIGIVADSERFTSPSIFTMTDRLPIFSYLVNSNRIRWYR
ncbi:MAG TPA: hypothetical protein DEV72_14175, partial [Ktedonobacter sp.]|nr:hypothetical protein [Ktedonobacter sp.]